MALRVTQIKFSVDFLHWIS